MAKKGESETPKLKVKLPVDPKMLGGIIIVLIIVAAVFMMRGSKGGDAAITPQPETAAPVAPSQSEAPAPVAAVECRTNIDCNDNDRCTTDACVAGNVCRHTTEPDCQVKTVQQPRITAVNFGAREDEFVQIEGNNWYVDNWVVTNGKGEVFIKFVNSYTTENYLNGKWIIYSKCDLSTGNAKYACKDKEFFSSTGDKAILKDDSGNIISEMTS